jgi:hypothetical protein
MQMASHMKVQALKKGLVVVCASIGVLVGSANACFADFVVFNYSGSITTINGPENVNVSAKFTINGNTLTIDLQNNAATPVPSAILTNLEWSINSLTSAPSLTYNPATNPYTLIGTTAKYTSATTTAALNTNTASGGDQSTTTAWGFLTAPSAPYNAGYALSAVSSGPFTTEDGLGYGIVGPGTNLSSFGTFPNPLFMNTSGPSGLEFTLSGINGFSASSITGVVFSFGGHTDTQGSAVVFQPATVAPEPVSWFLMATGIAGMAGYGWRRRNLVAA